MIRSRGIRSSHPSIVWICRPADVPRRDVGWSARHRQLAVVVRQPLLGFDNDGPFRWRAMALQDYPVEVGRLEATHNDGESAGHARAAAAEMASEHLASKSPCPFDRWSDPPVCSPQRIAP